MGGGRDSPIARAGVGSGTGPVASALISGNGDSDGERDTECVARRRFDITSFEATELGVTWFGAAWFGAA